MKLQTKAQKQEKSPHQRLAEIGEILATAIRRLDTKETSLKRDEQLDLQPFASVHGASNNLNLERL
jgi:hypothetical protein